jgi:hypothetical protein
LTKFADGKSDKIRLGLFGSSNKTGSERYQWKMVACNLFLFTAIPPLAFQEGKQ